MGHTITHLLSITAAVYKNTEAKHCYCTLHLEAAQAIWQKSSTVIKKLMVFKRCALLAIEKTDINPQSTL